MCKCVKKSLKKEPTKIPAIIAVVDVAVIAGEIPSSELQYSLWI